MDAIAVSLSVFMNLYWPRSKKKQCCNILVMTEIIFVDERYETVYTVFINCLIVFVIYLLHLLLFITLASSCNYIYWFALFRVGFLSLLCWKLFILLFFCNALIPTSILVWLLLCLHNRYLFLHCFLWSFISKFLFVCCSVIDKVKLLK